MLEVPYDESVISTVITVYQSSGEAVLCSQLVMPGSRHEIDDATRCRSGGAQSLG